jgi:hypothetical protein
MKTIYLIRHSAPFVEIENYEDYKNVPWKDYNRNMILSSEGETKAKKLCELEDFKNIDSVYAADSYRAIGTAKYVAEMNNLTDVEDGDLCTIYGETLVGMTEATSVNVEKLVISNEFSLSTEITSLKTLDLLVMGAGDRFVCNIYPVGMVVQYDIGGGQQTIQYNSARRYACG